MTHYFIINKYRNDLEVVYEFWSDDDTALGFLDAFQRQHNKSYILLKEVVCSV